MHSKKRLDYSAPNFAIPKVELTFELNETETVVTNSFHVKKLNKNIDTLVLDGEDLTLCRVQLNDMVLVENEHYVLTEDTLSISVHNESSEFKISIVTHINPKSNTSLEGLYFSNGAYCTQCEAEGFRKITYFLDRPDILSVYTVNIVSSSKDLTYMLSNGNKIHDSNTSNGSRTCTWFDPHPKPSYLFALVAGDFDLLEDEFITMSGRQVALQLFVEKGRGHQGKHAITSLKKAMKWDEDTYGLEYDLDIYMIVAVDFFNMGAMENKGLNVFNSKYVLADETTATDQDYFNIESIIAHEYFHNWTGNRVTCRDWFQLSLKEGLTVFRDQQFSADSFNALSVRIDQVKMIREHQFAEDAGPMSHPIRPDEVVEMNNFYTVTVYDKGAEVIRMLHTLLGVEGFRKGMDLYFERHDGQAVTCDDFVQAMQDANNTDLTHFKRWYSQSGTPIINVEQSIDVEGNTNLRFTQRNQATHDQTHKQSLYIPVKLECLDFDGKKLTLPIDNDTLVCDSEYTDLCLGKYNGDIAPSLLQDFSAPIRINYDYSSAQLLTIFEHSNNDFARWEASQKIYKNAFDHIYSTQMDGSKSSLSNDQFAQINDYLDALIKTEFDYEVLGQLLTLPTYEALSAELNELDPLHAYACNKALAKHCAKRLYSFCTELYKKLSEQQSKYEYEKEQVNQRKVKNQCLLLMASTQSEESAQFIVKQYESADNMTDKLAALNAAKNNHFELFYSLMTTFEQQYQNDAIVMDKWFAMHATVEREDILSHIDLLKSHDAFSKHNPNKVRSLIGSFAFYNVSGFHQKSGLGYKYLSDFIAELDKINPQVASRIVTPLIQNTHLANEYKQAIKHQLHRLFGLKGLSPDLFEKLGRALESSDRNYQ